jgi:hypothetical protein
VITADPWELRRPFSRKIRVDAHDILSETFTTGRRVDMRRPLEATLIFLAAAYREDYAAADDILERLAASGRVDWLRRLIATTDVRKTMLACFRAHLSAHGAIFRPIAERLLGLSRLIDPECDRVLAASAPVTPPQRLLSFDYARTLPRRLDVALIFRPRYAGPGSRSHDLSVRIRDAFLSAGLACRIIDPADEAAALGPCDLAIVDDSGLFAKNPRKKRVYLERLRRTAKVVAMFDPDPWQSHFLYRLAASRDCYDFVWMMAPREAARVRRIPVCQIPFPVGADAWFDGLAPVDGSATQCGAKFCGGMEDYNFHRYFWLLAGSAFAAPLAFELTSHRDDKQSVAASTKAYLMKFAERRACLSFTMRSDGQTIVVGRAFDALRAGRLLIQEQTPDMAAYFEPGVHHLEFRAAPELETLCGRLTEPGAFEEVRRAGAAFFNERYSNDAVVRNLVTFL